MQYPADSGSTMDYLSAGSLCLPCPIHSSALPCGVPFKKAPGSLPTFRPTSGPQEPCTLPQCPQGQGSVGPVQPGTLSDQSLNFPLTHKGMRKAPLKPSHLPRAEREVPVSVPPWKGTGGGAIKRGDCATHATVNPLHRNTPDLSFIGW